MTWRWVWLRSRLSAIAGSGMIWLVVLSLAPDVIATAMLSGLAVVVGWRTRPLLWWRYGATSVAGPDGEPVWRALIPIDWLRGRNQPRLSRSNRLQTGLVAVDRRHLVLGDEMLRQISQHAVTDQDLQRLVLRAIATAGVNRSRTVAAVEVFCLPWSTLATVARTIARPEASLRLPALAWRVRWLFIALAAVDLYRQAHWPGLVMLLLAATATVTTPRWNRDWASHQTAMADALECDHTPSDSGYRGSAAAPRRVRARRPATHRGGIR